MSRYIVRVENRIEVEAEDASAATAQALDDMAWGHASMLNVEILEVEEVPPNPPPTPSAEVRASAAQQTSPEEPQ